ncbi:MAG TPA: hypothetical protein VJ576_15905 [Rhodocyclaceae bacterium]|nr:hypothetical protein [Rhodocyclaceae bacterium]
MNRELSLAIAHGFLPGQLTLPPAPRGLAAVVRISAHPADDGLAADLATRGLGLLSMPLLTPEEGHFPDALHNVPLLTRRLTGLLDFLRNDGDTEGLPLGLLADRHAAPAAIRVAALRDAQVAALACHGGLIDLAGLENLRLLAAPLLMLVDEDDPASLASYERAAPHLSVPRKLVRLEPGQNPDTLVARWFGEHLQAL